MYTDYVSNHVAHYVSNHVANYMLCNRFCKSQHILSHFCYVLLISFWRTNVITYIYVYISWAQYPPTVQQHLLQDFTKYCLRHFTISIHEIGIYGHDFKMAANENGISSTILQFFIITDFRQIWCLN